ncbi:MAG: TrkA family potassium uptake protein [Bacteroidales bacterium]|nr:TrkA family potassium uptake protein [Bacteroidales bacterium]
MKIIVVGCGTFGKELAYRLFQRGHEVTVVDLSYAAFNSLPPDFKGRQVEGDVLNQEVLHRAGIKTADAVLATTGSDVLNMAVGHIAKEIYNVSNVIARNYEPSLRMLYEDFGLQLVSGSSWGIQRIEAMLYHNGVRTVFSAGNGEIEVYELTIPEQLDGKLLQDLLEPDVRVIALTRAGRAFIPDGNTPVEEGDVIHIGASFEGITAIQKKIASKAGEE